MEILALDIATKTGWAHTCGASGMQTFALRRGDSPGMRFIYLRAWLNSFLDSQPTKFIVYEQASRFGLSNAAVHVAHGLISVVEEVAATRNIEVSGRSASMIKNHATNKGNASKAMMIAAAKKRWGHIEIIDDNHADALHLLDLVLTEIGLPNRLTEHAERANQAASRGAGSGPSGFGSG